MIIVDKVAVNEIKVRVVYWVLAMLRKRAIAKTQYTIWTFRLLVFLFLTFQLSRNLKLQPLEKYVNLFLGGMFMKKRLLAYILMVLMLFSILPPETAFADSAPKPSVTIDFKGLEEETYYVTLLSEVKSRGPWNAEDEFKEWNGNKEAWEKFKAYEDIDGFYFLGCYGDCSENDRFIWSYIAPDRFKILVYFPEYDKLVVSEKIYERYAFDSYYTVHLSSEKIMAVEKPESAAAIKEAEVVKSYDFTGEMISLLCRIVLTILIETAVAWLFGFRKKSQIQLIFITNVVTQTILNILLNVIHYKLGIVYFELNYIWMELVVFVIEGLIFSRYLYPEDRQERKRVFPWLYAAAANSASFLLGMVLAKYIPGIF